ncbi:hypothetical protein Tco_0642368 [Tanacetum coccineum]
MPHKRLWLRSAMGGVSDSNDQNSYLRMVFIFEEFLRDTSACCPGEGIFRCLIATYMLFHLVLSKYRSTGVIDDFDSSAWRIFTFDIHHRFPAVERLQFHLSNKQSVMFDPSESIDFQLEKTSENTSKLLAWMECNKTDVEMLWNSPNTKFGIKLTKFEHKEIKEDFTTFDDVVYPTCKDACFARGLLDDGKEYIDGIIEASQ